VLDGKERRHGVSSYHVKNENENASKRELEKMQTKFLKCIKYTKE
jgi:hypothetical protein